MVYDDDSYEREKEREIRGIACEYIPLSQNVRLCVYMSYKFVNVNDTFYIGEKCVL